MYIILECFENRACGVQVRSISVGNGWLHNVLSNISLCQPTTTSTDRFELHM